MSLWKRIRNIWWLSGQEYEYVPAPPVILPLLKKKKATIVDTSNPLDNIDIP